MMFWIVLSSFVMLTMNITRTIIDGYEREELGIEVDDPQMLEKALRAKEVELRTRSVLAQAQGDMAGKLHEALSEQFATQVDNEAAAPGLGKDEVIHELEREESGQEVQDPEALARALRRKAEEIRARIEVQLHAADSAPRTSSWESLKEL